jgi:hypothetical protein
MRAGLFLMSIYNEAEEAFEEVGGQLDEAFTLGGVSGYAGTFSEEEKLSEFSEFSNVEKVKRSCTALKSYFSSKPDPSLRVELVYASNTYVLVGIREDQLHYHLELEKRT